MPSRVVCVVPIWESKIRVARRSAQNTLEVVQIDAVPGEEKETAVLTLGPQSSRRGVVRAADVCLINPTRWVALRQIGWISTLPALHDLDAAAQRINRRL